MIFSFSSFSAAYLSPVVRLARWLFSLMSTWSVLCCMSLPHTSSAHVDGREWCSWLARCVISSSTHSDRPPLSPVVISTEFPSAVGLYKIIEIINFPAKTLESFQTVGLEHYLVWDLVRLVSESPPWCGAGWRHTTHWNVRNVTTTNNNIIITTPTIYITQSSSFYTNTSKTFSNVIKSTKRI